MFTADDVKAIRNRTSGGSINSPAASISFTANDVKKIRERLNVDQMQQAPKYQPVSAAPKIETPNYSPKQPTPQQIANYNKLHEIAAKSSKPAELPAFGNKPLASGRDFAVIPQAKPNAERDAYIADYMKKYPNAFMGETGANIAYTLDNLKPIKFAQNLAVIANPLKGPADTLSYLDNQAKARVAAENDALAKMAELEERAKTDPSVLTSKEYFDAASKASRINYADQALQQAVPDDKDSFKSVGEILNKQSQQATNELLEGKTGLGKFATEAAIGTADLIGTVGMAGMLGVPTKGLMAVRSGAQTGQQALDNGESYDRAGGAAVGSGLITYGIEGMGGLFGSWGSKAAGSLAKTEIGKKVLSKVPQNVADWIAKAADTWLGRKVADGLSEGVEEFTEYYAQGFFNNLLLDEDTPLSVKEALYNFGIGTTIGTALGGSNRSVINNAPVTRAQEGVQIENPAQEVQGKNVLEPLETEIKAKREREMHAGEALRVSGLVNNEAANKVNRRTRRAVDAMAKKIGVKVMFDSTLSGEQGSYDPDNREIHVALDSSDPIGVVMTHEITHRMKETSPEQYEQLKNLAFEIMQENGSYDNVLASVADAYGNDTALIEDEMVAHFTRVMTEDIATFERLAGVDRNLAQKIFDLLDELLRKAGWDNNANVALDSLFGDISPQRLQSVRNSWAQALQNADAGAAGVGDTRQMFVLAKDPNVIAAAEQMERAGASEEEIWQNNKIVRDIEGNWLKEIDDSKSVFYPFGTAKTPFKFGKKTLEDYLKHDELFNELPALKNVPVKAIYNPLVSKNGSYSSNDGIKLYNKGIKKGTLLHETQHAEQEIEGRRRGANRATAASTWLNSMLNIVKNDSHYVALKTADDRLDYLMSFLVNRTQANSYPEAVHEYYKRNSGETEARQTKQRANYSEGERLTNFPQIEGDWYTDVSLIDLNAVLEKIGFKSDSEKKLAAKKLLGYNYAKGVVYSEPKSDPSLLRYNSQYYAEERQRESAPKSAGRGAEGVPNGSGANNEVLFSKRLDPAVLREKLAIETFGTTYRFSEAGYITPSGQLLDFSGRKQGARGGYRTMDHREVSELFDDQIGDGYSEYMNRFIAEGNIRVMQDVGVDLGVTEPTAKQYATLRRFIEKTVYDNEYFSLDFSAEDGRPIANREYEGKTPAKKIIDDIKYYYKNGELPYKSEMADFLYSRPLDPNAINRKGEILQQLQNAPKQQKPVKMDADLDESIKALMYDIDANEMARRARAAAKAPNEKTAELLSNTSNGIIESDSIDDSAQLLGKVSFAANKTISQVLDQAVRGSKGDLPLNKQQMQQLRNNLYNAIEKPLNEAKAKYINGIKSKAGSFAKDMARLGIKPGSKESAAVQWIGEGQRQGPDGEVIEYTLADLQQQFPNKWQNIAEASKICRNIYDAYVNEINDALKLVYPDVEARAAATMDKINARVAYNTNQAQIWLDKAAQLEQRLSAAQAETHSAESMAATKTAERVNRLANQLEAANQTVERYTRAAEAARAKAQDLQRMINSGEILRNKRLVPRKDYFHHFNEMEQGLGGFVNIISGAHDISAQLAGKSEFTKPKSKWWSALQQRTGGKYTEDAIGGMARYIPAAEYKIAFDPFIAQMRGNVEALVNATEKTKNANDLIEYLTDWTNDLAGKTNFLDRPIQKLFSRKSMKALEFLNNRAKANAVAGNLGSAIVQIGNIPNAMMFINNPADWASAAQDIATGNGKEGQSIFLNERYIGNTLDKLQKSSPIKDASNWMLEIGDRQAARLIWNAAYNQFESGRAKGLRQYENAVDYADDITRRAIAGRGVGEMALTQKSRVIKLFAPFQVEVNNTYNLLVEKMGEKDAAALMSYAVGAWAINSLLYVITGRRALFDPIDALIDAIRGMRDEDEEDERTKGERVAGAISRVGGEVISNMPYASTAATFLTGTENSEKIFGEADPTRYGTGNIAVQTLTEPIAQFINGEKVDLLGPATAILPAYGGKQIERTVRGAQSLGYLPRVDISSGGVDIDRNEFGASKSASGRIRFPITEPADQLKTMLFGEWSTSRGKDYIDKGLQPLSDKQSEAMEKVFAAGISPDTYYDALLAARKAVSQKDANGKTIPLSQDKNKVKLIKEAVPGLTTKEYNILYEALGISKNAY